MKRKNEGKVCYFVGGLCSSKSRSQRFHHLRQRFDNRELSDEPFVMLSDS